MAHRQGRVRGVSEAVGLGFGQSWFSSFRALGSSGLRTCSFKAFYLGFQKLLAGFRLEKTRTLTRKGRVLILMPPQRERQLSA